MEFVRCQLRPYFSGKEVLRPGFEITMSGVPRGGDSFQILPGSNTAGQIKFLLTRPHDFAAASPIS